MQPMANQDAKVPRWLRDSFQASHRGARPEEFKRWLRYVGEIQVKLFPGARAVLHHPKSGSARAGGITIEVRWRANEVIIRGAGFMPWGPVDLAAYLTALRLERERRPPPRQNDAPLPATGRPPSIAFYRSLVAEYEALKREGHKAPLKELAARRGAPIGTVKSWHSRGRRYVKGDRA
jgi:hypothetical protein